MKVKILKSARAKKIRNDQEEADQKKTLISYITDNKAHIQKNLQL